jgi:hypothetical protein
MNLILQKDKAVFYLSKELNVLRPNKPLPSNSKLSTRIDLEKASLDRVLDVVDETNTSWSDFDEMQIRD